MIQGDVDKDLLKYPAITICPKVSTKYAIAERLGNYIDPNNLPKKVSLLKKELLKCYFDSPMEIDKKKNVIEVNQYILTVEEFYQNCNEGIYTGSHYEKEAQKCMVRIIPKNNH